MSAVKIPRHAKSRNLKNENKKIWVVDGYGYRSVYHRD
jgi:hypothetical protein